MGLMGVAAIAGMFELPPRRRPVGGSEFTIEQYARLAGAVVADAGLDGRVVDGLVTGHLGESSTFVPSTIAEYLGIPANFAEIVDLGGANAVGMVWRAAAAVELGICQAVLCVIPGSWDVPTSPRKPVPGLEERSWFGASSNLYGSPQAEFDVPFGNLGQNAPYAQIARRYGEVYGYDDRAMAKIAVDQRTNACAMPDAVFHGQPITVEDVLASPLIADPLHRLEIVMPCQGGAAVLVTNADLARRSRNRPVWIKGFGERVPYKTPTYADDLLVSPIKHAAAQAFAMAGLAPDDVDMVSLYDCYTITVLMSLEDAGFCEKGKGMQFVRDHDLTFRGDFPMNTAGGQLSFGQAGSAGGMHHVCDATRQLTGRAGEAQVADCDIAFVSGNGGIMSEQGALVLQGD
ncbi:thiolase family protein [Nocardioides sp. LHG3406-4]|uniref:thiolase family protein n=1 Tax=Nocardioides sp. LHG3406-4 TaxID=2804575 RepID=UPI003CF924BE